VALSLSAMRGGGGSLLEKLSRWILNLSTSLPTAGLHTPTENIGLKIPTLWEDYCGAAVRLWTRIRKDEGALCTTARASLNKAACKFRHWPLELAFH